MSDSVELAVFQHLLTSIPSPRRLVFATNDAIPAPGRVRDRRRAHPDWAHRPAKSIRWLTGSQRIQVFRCSPIRISKSASAAWSKARQREPSGRQPQASHGIFMSEASIQRSQLVERAAFAGPISLRALAPLPLARFSPPSRTNPSRIAPCSPRSGFQNLRVLPGRRRLVAEEEAAGALGAPAAG